MYFQLIERSQLHLIRLTAIKLIFRIKYLDECMLQETKMTQTRV